MKSIVQEPPVRKTRMNRFLCTTCLLVFVFSAFQCKKSKPDVAFSLSSNEVEEREDVEFINETKGASGYEWYFGDGEESTEKNPVHAYRTEGEYFISLVAFNKNQKAVAYASITVTGGTGGNTARLLIVVIETGTEQPVDDCRIRIYDNFSDYENNLNPVDDGTTDSNGEIVFENLEPGLYYIHAGKSTGDEVWNNNGLPNTITVVENEETEFTALVSRTDPSVAFRMVFTNASHTVIDIFINFAEQSVEPGGVVEFAFTDNPGTVSYYAETSGKTGSGTQIGEEIVWDYSDIYVSGLEVKSTNLIIGENIFFIYMQNSGFYNLSPIEVYSVDQNYSFTEELVIPNDDVLYRLGYYVAHEDIAVEAFYQGLSNSGLGWDRYDEFDIPGEENQSVTLHSDDGWEFFDFSPLSGKYLNRKYVVSEALMIKSYARAENKHIRNDYGRIKR